MVPSRTPADSNKQSTKTPTTCSIQLLFSFNKSHSSQHSMDRSQMINPNFSYPFDSDYHSWRKVPAFCEDWMTGSSCKRISKWDLREAPHLLPGEHNDAGPGRPSNKEPQHRWRYGEGNYKEGRESLDASDFWDGDTTYGTKMSPGLDEWRQQKLNRSPVSGRGRSYRSRSRSRSPERGFKRADSNDSIGVQPCKDIVAGRCRRADLCPHSHQDYKYSEDRKYLGSGLADSWEGRHRRIDASKYFSSDDARERTPRTGRSNDFSRRSANEVLRERESDRRDRVSSFEHNRTHESRRSGDIVCKFFAAGNCRNGKFCRFSHHGQTRDSSDNRTRNDWRQGVNSLDRMDSLKEGSMWSGTAVSDVANFSMWNEDRSGGLGVPEQRSISRSVDDSLPTDSRFMVHRMDNDKAIEDNERDCLQLTADNPGSSIGVAESRGADFQVADMEISPAWDYRLPSSNHIVKEESRHTAEPSKFSFQDEVALLNCQQDIICDVNQKDQTVAVMQPLILQTPYFQQNHSSDNDALNRFSCENRNTTRDSTLPHIDLNFSAYVLPGESLDQNGQGSTTVTQPYLGLNADDKNQQIFAPYTPKDKSFTYIGNLPPPQEETSSKSDVLDTIKSDVISDNPLTQIIVNSEQFSNLTVSLARLLESGKQLPELYAALNGSNPMGFMQTSLSNSAGTAAFPAPISSQPKSAVGSQKQYDPVTGSMELTKSEISNLPGEVVPNSSENKTLLGEKPEIQAQLPPFFPGGPSGVDLYRTDSINVDLNINIDQLSREDQNGNNGGKENNTMKVEERNKGQDNGVLGKTRGDGRADENKKNNDGKAIRAFKFALAEFVKELLKPTWKEGQINKDTHKTIVKKVVDKVTGTLQGGHIPQSQEKIDSYLSSSKPKLSKLVQAYVEKNQKEKPAVT